MSHVVFPEVTPEWTLDDSRRIIAEFTKLNPTLILTEDLKDVFLVECGNCGFSKRRRIQLDWIEEGPRRERAEVLIKAWRQEMDRKHGEPTEKNTIWMYDILQCIYCAGAPDGRDFMVTMFAKAIEDTLEPL